MSNDIKSGLGVGISKLLGSDAAQIDTTTYDALLEGSGLESILSKTDAADLDLEEITELLFVTHQAWWDEDDGNSSTPPTDKQKDLQRIKAALLETLGISNNEFQTLFNVNKDKSLEEKVDAIAQKSGENLGIIDANGPTADIDDVQAQLEDKIDEHENEVFAEVDYSTFSRGDLIATADDPNAESLFRVRAFNALASDPTKSDGVGEAFENLYQESPSTYKEDTIFLLTSMAEYFENGALDITEDQFKSILKEAIDALPEADREEFLQGIIDITGESEGSEFFVSSEASDLLLDASLEYAENNAGISDDIKDALSGAQDGVTDQNNFFQDDADLSSMSEDELVNIITGEPAAAPGEPAAAPGEPAAAPGEPTAAPGELAAAPGEPTAAPDDSDIYSDQDKARALLALASDPSKSGGITRAFDELHAQDPEGYQDEVLSILTALAEFSNDEDQNIDAEIFQTIFDAAANTVPAA